MSQEESFTEPQDWILLPVCGGWPKEECKVAESLIYELCKDKVMEVMDLKMDSFKHCFIS